MQDSVGKFVEISFPWGDAAPTSVSKDIAFDDHAWTVHCYPRGAPGEAGAGGHLSIHFVNHTNARNAMVVLEAVVLRKADAQSSAGDGAVAPSFKNFHASSVFEYPAEGSRRFPWPRVAAARELHEDCAVGGYVTVVCGLMVLRHNPIPAPPSTFAADLGGLVEARRKFGDPDASFAVGGRTFDVVRKVLAARSAVLSAELEGANTVDEEEAGSGGATVEDATGGTVEEAAAGGSGTVPVVRPRHEFNAFTFCAVLLYIYCDRLPRDNECGCTVTMDLVRDLLAAADWYKLERLKLLCARWLWGGLSVATVSKTLWYADRYKCPRLKSLCIDFVTAGDNLRKVFSTKDFVALIQESPWVHDEINMRLIEAQDARAGRDDEGKRIKRRLEAQNAGAGRDDEEEKRIKRRLEAGAGRDDDEEKSGGSSRVIAVKRD